MPKSETRGGLSAFLSLAGALAGSLIGVLLAGYVESQKLEEVRRSEAIDAFIEASWDPTTKDTDNRYMKLLNKVAVYAPESVLSALRDYQVTDCAERGDPTPECRELWAKVVKEMRDFAGADGVHSDLIIKVLWGRAAASPPDPAEPPGDPVPLDSSPAADG